MCRHCKNVAHRRQKADRVMRNSNLVHRRWHCYVASSMSNHIWIWAISYEFGRGIWWMMDAHTTINCQSFMTTSYTQSRMGSFSFGWFWLIQQSEWFHANIKCIRDGRCMLVWFMFYMLYWGLPLPSIHDGMNRLFYYTIYYSQYVVNVGILYRVLHHICSEGV